MVTINAVERTFKLIECLSENPAGKRVLQLAAESGLPPSTAHRVLQTLARAGYVSQDPDNGPYKLTGRLLDVASRAVTGRPLRVEARRYLERLRDLTGESAHLTVLDGKEAITVESVLSNERNLIDCRVGERPPLHCTAVGKCLIAFKPQNKLEEIISTLELVRFTDHTICTVAGLKDDLARVREVGYALDWDENEFGVRCIAAPVRDASGDVIASIGVSGPAIRITDDKRDFLAAHVSSVATDISRDLGWTA